MNIEQVYLELELYFNKKYYEDGLLDYKEYKKTENKIIKRINNISK